MPKEELHASAKYKRIENGTIKQRDRKKIDILRDLTISNAKNTYLQSNQKFEDLENLLNTFKLFVQEFLNRSIFRDFNRLLLYFLFFLI